ncbi:unnamed protein product [Trichogramma brassicae]|uniref:Uncharacterized protein n=1 Tax=Trichogramma brassicae TaxID=86971 RepID=A0A6H5ICZ7_9HYME|nr:unnamed protein product [Trichogramma brassicae]
MKLVESQKKKAEEENRRIIAPGFIIYKQNSRPRIPRCLIRYARLAMCVDSRIPKRE